MAIANLGTFTCDFDTRADIIVPGIVLDRNDGHGFFLAANPITTELNAGYLNVFFLMGSTQGELTSPLALKWFPNGRRMLFYFGLPRTFLPNNVPTSILLQPKEFSPNLEPIRQFDFEVLWDDQGRANANNVSYPTQ